MKQEIQNKLRRAIFAICAMTAMSVMTTAFSSCSSSDDDDEKVNILLKTSKDTIKEMLIVDIDGDEATLVQIKGKIKRSDIDKMVKFSTK